MVLSFDRIGAALGMKVEDYYTEGRRAWFRLHEKGGKRHEVPAHHNAEDYLDAYIVAAGIGAEKKPPPLPLHRPAPSAHRPPDAPH
jgi:integrase